MVSFFEKLKKGMGVEEVEELEEVEEKTIKKTPKRKKAPVFQAKKTKIKKAQPEEEPEEEAEEEIEEKEAPEAKVKKLGIKPVFADEDSEPETVEVSPQKNEEEEEAEESKEKWFEPEGQLAIDIYQTETDLVIQSAIAGVKPDSLDIAMEKDVITIRGSREKPFEESGDFFTQECFWGPFSREIILPSEVDPNKAKAEMKEGILTIRIPKMLREKKRKIVVS